jgi:hypothetical protein
MSGAATAWLGGRTGRVYRLTRTGGARYVGDVRAKIVHDRWHPDCEGCLTGMLISEGAAVGFESDDLDEALLEGFECCSWCFDRSEPRSPSAAGAGIACGSADRAV